MGYQDWGGTRGGGRGGGRGRGRGGGRGGSRGRNRGEGSGEGQDTHVRRGGQERQSFGLKSGGARGSQSAADALRKRQKANKAALTKRHAVYKSKTRLLHELEENNAAAGGVYVAPELSSVISRDDQADGRKEIVRKRGRGGADDLSSKRKSSSSAEVGDQREVSKSDDDCDSSGDDDDDEVANDRAVAEDVQGSDENVQAAPAGPARLESLPVSGEGKIMKKRKYQPFQKELDIAAARQREIVRQSVATVVVNFLLCEAFTTVCCL